MIAAGLFAATLAPLEFSLFKDVTKELAGFRYLGFAAHSAQILGFYLVALVLVPLGYGHLLLRSWAHKLSLTALWSCLILGIPCMALVMFIFVGYKDPTDHGALLFAAASLFMYPVLPFMLVRFYHSQETKAQFQSSSDHLTWIEAAPQPVLILGSVTAFYVFAFHTSLFLNGVVPFGCGFRSGKVGYVIAATAIVGLSFVAWGMFNQRRWAWFGGVVCFATMAVDFAVAFLCSGSTGLFRQLGVSNLDESLVELQFPSLQIALVLVLPTMCALITTLFNRRHFDRVGTKAELWVGLLSLVILMRLWSTV